MATVVEIVNQALVELGGGAELIEALDEDSANARNANAIWATVRDSLLAMHPWNFALKRAEVDADAGEPAFGWLRRFALPADCLQVFRLNDMPARRLPWEIEGGFLLTDEATPVNMRYIARIEETADWSAAFTDAVAGEIAARLAITVANSQTSAAEARKEAERRLREARWVDAREQGALERPPGRIERWRRQGLTGAGTIDGRFWP